MKKTTLNVLTLKKIVMLIIVLLVSNYLPAQEWLSLLPEDKLLNQTYTFEEEKKAFYEFWEAKGKAMFERGEKIEGYKHFKRRELIYERNGEFNKYTEAELLDTWNSFNATQSRSSSCFKADSLKYFGPKKYNYAMGLGVMFNVYANPTNHNELVARDQYGYVWKSANFGNNWTEITPSTITSAINRIAIYGNKYILTSSTQSFISLNKGITWSNYTVLGNVINQYAFSTANPNKIIATGSGKTFLSNDGGTTWTILFNNMELGSLVPNNGNANIWYARAVSNGLYKSTDGGLTWNLLTLPLTSAFAPAVSAASSNTIYLAYHTNPAKIYKSVDYGTTWTLVNSTQIPTGQLSWNIAFNVSPTNPNHLIYGTIYAYESNDGGITFAKLTTNSFDKVQLHPDSHHFSFVGNSDSLLYANDGGIYFSNFNNHYFSGTNFRTSLKILSEDIEAAQIWGLDYFSPSNYSPLYLYSYATIDSLNTLYASWHNGTTIIHRDSTFTLYGGDGFGCATTKKGTLRTYASSQNGGICVTNLTNSNVVMSNLGGSFNTSLTLEEDNPNIIYCTSAANGIMRSTNYGGSWTKILNHGTFALSKINGNVLHHKRNDSIYYSINKGLSWNYYPQNIWASNNITIYNGSSYGATIIPSKRDSSTIFIINFSAGVSGYISNICKVTGFGTSLTNITYNYPFLPGYCYEVDDNDNLYVGTTNGVLVLENNSTSWQSIPGTLKRAVNILKYDKTRGQLLVGTNGRGIYASNIYPIKKQVYADVCEHDSIQLFGNYYPSIDSTYFDTLSFASGCDSVVFSIHINSIPCITTTINDEQKQAYIKLYPNPAKDQFSIEFICNEKTTGNVKIMNSLSQIVYQQNQLNIEKGQNKIRISNYNLSTGYYLISFEMPETKAIYYQKLIIEN